MTSLSASADPPCGPAHGAPDRSGDVASGGTRALRDAGGRVAGALRPWPNQPGVAHLVLHDHSLSHVDPATVGHWLRDARSGGYTEVRTGALSPRQQALMSSAQFEVMQHLVLLERPTLLSGEPVTSGEPVALSGVVRTLRPTAGFVRRRIGGQGGSLREIVDVDAAAFEPSWCLDADAIVDACRATPRSRVRGVRMDGQLVAYAISGMAGRDGYLQRLAVRPHAQRRGFGRALVIDSLRWCDRQGTRQVLVNTHVENHVAIALYQHLGFTDRHDGLVVMRRIIDGAQEATP